ncbi:MAG: hypothetical protein WC460_02125 [Patescibacteria group bacterium]
MFSGIRRVVSVDYTRTPEEVINATGRVISKESIVIVTIPECEIKNRDKAEIAFTHRKEYVETDALRTMPACETQKKDNVEVVFFTLFNGKVDYIPFIDLDREFKNRGMIYDPYAVAAVNENELEFADEFPNMALWKIQDQDWGYAIFYRDEDGCGRIVSVRRSYAGSNSAFENVVWFGGVRK